MTDITALESYLNTHNEVPLPEEINELGIHVLTIQSNCRIEPHPFFHLTYVVKNANDQDIGMFAINLITGINVRGFNSNHCTLLYEDPSDLLGYKLFQIGNDNLESASV